MGSPAAPAAAGSAGAVAWPRRASGGQGGRARVGGRNVYGRKVYGRCPCSAGARVAVPRSAGQGGRERAKGGWRRRGRGWGGETAPDWRHHSQGGGGTQACARSGQTGGVEAAGGPCGGVAGVAPPAAPAAGEVACRDAAAFQNFGAREAGRKTGHVYSIRRAYFAMKSAQILPREPWTSFVLFRLCRGQEVRAGQSNGTRFRPGLRIRSGIVDWTTVCHRRESTLRPAKSFATLINAGRLMPE